MIKGLILAMYFIFPASIFLSLTQSSIFFFSFSVSFVLSVFCPFFAPLKLDFIYLMAYNKRMLGFSSFFPHSDFLYFIYTPSL